MSDLFRLPHADVPRRRVSLPLRRDVRIRTCLDDLPDSHRIFGAPLSAQIHCDVQPAFSKSAFPPMNEF